MTKLHIELIDNPKEGEWYHVVTNINPLEIDELFYEEGKFWIIQGMFEKTPLKEDKNFGAIRVSKV